MSGCPNGCPCDDYVCPSPSTTTALTSTTPTWETTTTTTTSNTDVLILLTNCRDWTDCGPVVTNAAGLDDRNINFDFAENTEVAYSCGLTFRNQYFVFGGGSIGSSQISQVIDCQLKRIGQLSFDFEEGGCANVRNNRIYLCFNDAPSDHRKCRMASSPTDQFEQISYSIYHHESIRIAASDSKFRKFKDSINLIEVKYWR